MSFFHIKQTLKQNHGAAAVEFAFALVALFAFFAIFMQFAVILLAGERVSFAGYAASRTHAVQGNAPAINTALAIEPGIAVDFQDSLVLTRNIPIPAGIDRYLTRGEGRFVIRHVSPLFREPRYNDDNRDPF